MKSRANKKTFQWDAHDIEELRKEYYIIWVTHFAKKYHTSPQTIYKFLWALSEDILSNQASIRNSQRKNKIKQTQERALRVEVIDRRVELEIPVYEWPFKYLFNRQLWVH